MKRLFSSMSRNCGNILTVVSTAVQNRVNYVIIVGSNLLLQLLICLYVDLYSSNMHRLRLYNVTIAVEFSCFFASYNF